MQSVFPGFELESPCPFPTTTITITPRAPPFFVFIYLFSVPPPEKYSTRPFLKWIRTQGCSPHLRPCRHPPPQRGRPRGQEAKQQTIYAFIVVFVFLYLFSVPPPDKYGTRPFFKSGSGRRAAAHTRQVKSKNTFGPVGTPQRGRPKGQETNNKLVVFFFLVFVFQLNFKV